jgi:hypothetical protein
LLLNLGHFSRAVGCKAAVPAVIYAMPTKFETQGIKSTDGIVKLSVETDSKPVVGDRQEVRFVFEIPPGAPSMTRTNRNPVHISVDTNHPTLKRLDFDVEFVAQ